jgi:hypothetical protein
MISPALGENTSHLAKVINLRLFLLFLIILTYSEKKGIYFSLWLVLYQGIHLYYTILYISVNVTSDEAVLYTSDVEIHHTSNPTWSIL